MSNLELKNVPKPDKRDAGTNVELVIVLNKKQRDCAADARLCSSRAGEDIEWKRRYVFRGSIIANVLFLIHRNGGLDELRRSCNW